MVYPYAINFESKVIFYKEPYVDDKSMVQIKTASFEEIELMQYTGSKDKNAQKAVQKFYRCDDRWYQKNDYYVVSVEPHSVTEVKSA